MWVRTTEISIVQSTRTLEIAIKHFTSIFCRATPYLRIHSDFVRVSVVLGVASNCQSCGEITVDLLANRKTFKRDFQIFLFTPILRLTQYGG